MKKTVFLETHNIKNPTTGFGVFNYCLIKGISNLDTSNLEITVSAKDTQKLEKEFKRKFKYKKIFGFNRYKAFRIRKKYDLWHSVNQNTRIEPRKSRKYLLTIHDVNFAENPENNGNKQYTLFVEKLQKADAITYISEFAKKQTHTYFDVPNVPEYVIYNGNPITEIEDTSDFISEVNVEKPFLYSIGDFLEKKNFNSIVAMMQFIPEYNLIISGNNNKEYGEKVKQTIVDLNLQDRVFLTGKVSEKGKQFYLKNCSAFVFPSLGEGFGLPPIEAMKFGNAIFLADRTSLKEVGGEHCFYWDEFDPKYMASVFHQGMKQYSENKAFYIAQYKERGDSFSWKNATKQYLEVYNFLLSSS